MKQLPSRSPAKRLRAKAFSLVELALALGIMAFAMAGIVGLIPFGLTSFRQAMNNTVESGIIQSLTNEIFLSEFANLKSMAKSDGKVYYFDADGDPITSAADGAIRAGSGALRIPAAMEKASFPICGAPTRGKPVNQFYTWYLGYSAYKRY